MSLKKLEKAFIGKKIALDFFGVNCIDAEIMRIIPFSEIKNAISDESSIYNEWYDLSEIRKCSGLQDQDPIAIVEISYSKDNYCQVAYPLEMLRHNIL